MKYLSFGAVGFFLNLLAHTLFGSWAFVCLICGYASILYLLFFGSEDRRALALLTGFTVGEELLGTAHLGLASSLALVLVALAELLAKRMRFSSSYLQYIVALFIGITAFSLLMFPWDGAFHRLLAGWLIIPFLCLATYLVFSFRQSTAYELI